MIATPAPRLTYQTISTAQRRAVIEKIAALTTIVARGRNEHCGCCWNHLCDSHLIGYRLAVLRLTNYAVRGAP